MAAKFQLKKMFPGSLTIDLLLFSQLYKGFQLKKISTQEKKKNFNSRKYFLIFFCGSLEIDLGSPEFL